MWLSWPIPLDWFLRLFILFPRRCLLRRLLLILTVVFAWIELTEGDLDVCASFGVHFVRTWIELLHDGLTWNHGQSFLKHFENLVEIDMEVGLLLSLLL